MASLDLNSDLKDLVKQRLSDFGHPPKPDEDLDAILIRYLNLARRFPAVVRWILKQSREITNRSLGREIQEGLDQFIKRAQSGEDLRPYLSTHIADPDYSDLMFYDWGIFHFHLGVKLNHRGFFERTDELLFAMTDPGAKTMYLIDTHPHKGGFANQDLLRILEDNWPEILDRHTLKGVLGLSYHASDDEIEKMRKAGVSVSVQTPGGRVLVPMGGGITTARTGVSNRIEANWAKGVVKELEKRIRQDIDKLEEYFKAKHRISCVDLKFKLTTFGSVVTVEETTTGEVVYQHRM